MNAQKMHQEQRSASLKKHVDRIAWLSSDNPVYADGLPVKKSDVIMLLAQSRRILANPCETS